MKIGYQSGAYASTMYTELESGSVDSRQLHLCSTHVLSGIESCRVIQDCLYKAKALKLRKSKKPHRVMMILPFMSCQFNWQVEAGAQPLYSVLTLSIMKLY